jgi:hypothetical protein
MRLLVLDERKALAGQLGSLERREADLNNFVKSFNASLQRMREAIIDQIESLDGRLKELDAWQDDPTVLVRTSAGGYGRPTYHDSRRPCRRVGDPQRFSRLLLGEAQKLRYRPCTACAAHLQDPAI